jgi:hypothetical protein
MVSLFIVPDEGRERTGAEISGQKGEECFLHASLGAESASQAKNRHRLQKSSPLKSVRLGVKNVQKGAIFVLKMTDFEGKLRLTYITGANFVHLWMDESALEIGARTLLHL